MRASKKSISEQLNAFSSRMAALPQAMSEIWHRATCTLLQLSLACAAEGASAHQAPMQGRRMLVEWNEDECQGCEFVSWRG